MFLEPHLQFLYVCKRRITKELHWVVTGDIPPDQTAGAHL
jgi:hypothetical protein